MIVTLGLSHHSSPVELRERFAFPESRIPEALDKLRGRGNIEEAVILSTCNRVEIYAVAADCDATRGFSTVREFLSEFHGHNEPLGAEFYALTEPDSLRHLFRVAAGLDSMVMGETEILGQLKQSYQLALQNGHTGNRLNRAFQKAFQTAKQIRTETKIQRGCVSVASAAVGLAEHIFNSLAEQEVLVVGAGDTSEKTARALLSRGARGVVVANRTGERSEALAESLGGRAIPFENWERELEHLDIVISSTSSPGYVLERRQLEPILKRRHGRALLLVDIAVPRDIDPSINLLDSVYLYNVDDLQGIADDSLRQRREELDRCEAIIAERLKAMALSSAAPDSSPFYQNAPTRA
ncbi:MAG: glutamyl-tRNA reductase [Terrimicrobiaceae bacterium]